MLNAYDPFFYLSSVSSQSEKRDTVHHNLGISYTLEGMAVCHSVWSHGEIGEKMDILAMWAEAHLSPKRLAEHLTGIVEEWDASASHRVDVFCDNSSVLDEIMPVLKRGASYCEGVQPSSDPSKAPAFLIGLMHDGQLAVPTNQRQAVEQAFRGIGVDEQGKAIGSPESLSLLLGIAEPFHYYKNGSLIGIGHRAAERIRALVG